MWSELGASLDVVETVARATQISSNTATRRFGHTTTFILMANQPKGDLPVLWLLIRSKHRIQLVFYSVIDLVIDLYLCCGTDSW